MSVGGKTASTGFIGREDIIMRVETKQLKVFGYGLAVILIFFAWRFWAKQVNLIWVPIFSIAALLLILVTKFQLAVLIPLYSRWMRAAHFIGNIVTVAVLSILYYCVFGLVGIVLRLLRKDLLDRVIDDKSPSYWHKRPPSEFQKERYLKQF